MADTERPDWKSLKEVYPEHADKGDDDYLYFDEYVPLLRSFGYQIVIQIDEGEYSGDSFVLYRRWNKDNAAEYGILVFGWGSCPGCDALQGCHQWAEVEALRQQLYNDIHWGNRADTLIYLDERAERNEWHGHIDEANLFFDLVHLYVERQNAP